MRILMIRALPELTAEAVHAMTTANELMARGHEVFIVSGSSPITTQATQVSLELDQRSFWRPLAHIAALVRLMRKHRIQVVHEYSRAATWVSWFATRVAGVPMIHSTDVVEPILAGQRIPAIGDRPVLIGAATDRMSSPSIGPARASVQARALSDDTLGFEVSGAAGLVSTNVLAEYPASQFGNSGFNSRQLGQVFVKNEPGYAVHAVHTSATRFGKSRVADTPNLFVNRLELAYRSMYVKSYRREIPVLCYHRLVESDADCGKFATYVRVERFEQQLRYLRDHGYRTLHFSDLTSAQVFEKKQRAVILTFDDGYEDNYRLLLPLLRKYNAKAVIYLVSGCEANDWDLPEGEKSFRLMNQSQRREMLASGLVEFGAHTVSHSDLSEVSHEQADREIHQSKVELETSLGVAVNTFAYPYGRLTAHVKERVRHAGFQFGIATDSGPLALHEDPFEVRRIVIFPGTTLRSFGRKVSGGYTFSRTRA